MKYKLKNFDTSSELESYLNDSGLKKADILFVGPSKFGFTLIFAI